MEEAGIAGYEVLEWNPVFGPAGMPAATADRLRSAMRKAVAEPEVLGRIRSLSGEAFPDGPPALVTAFLKAQQSQWAKVIRERNITTG
jgi:tripartite-type tricarboxylate transporter receptor subunit TctC